MDETIIILSEGTWFIIEGVLKHINRSIKQYNNLMYNRGRQILTVALKPLL